MFQSVKSLRGIASKLIKNRKITQTSLFFYSLRLINLLKLSHCTNIGGKEFQQFDQSTFPNTFVDENRLSGLRGDFIFLIKNDIFENLILEKDHYVKKFIKFREKRNSQNEWKK